MKKLFTLFLLAILPLIANAQVKRTVNVETAGTLSTLISDGEKYTIDELTLTGELNGTDLKLVREMVGCDYLGQQTQGKVTKLDLSGIRIVAGGEKYLDTKEISNSRGERTTNSNGFVFSSGNDVLGSYLFAGCDKLEEIKLPNSIKTIGDNVFHFGYGLTSLAIPKNVTSIGHAVIIYCQNLVSLSVEEGNTVFSSPDGSNAVIKGNTLVMGCNTTVIPNTITTIGNSAFFGIGKWGSKMVLPSNVTTIENDAFACSNFTEVEMSEGIKTIGEYAFAWTPITNFQIPVSVTSIGFRVLYGCQNVESIVVKNNNTNYDSRDNSNAIIDKTSNTVIQGCKNTVIPQSVKTIGNSAFEQLNNLESFTIPSWITSIGDRAFADCWNMKDITSEIEDPSAVTMGRDVFSNYNQNQQRTLYVPSGTKDAYEAISVWKKDFYEIVEKEPEKKEVTLHVATAGSLPSLISDDEKYDITDLTLTGELNGSDFRLLRDMTGNDYQGNLTNGKLSKLDLSGATIVSGGDYYINTTTIHWTDNMQMVMVNPMQFNTNNNELGSYLFAGCKSLVTIILPRNITAIRSDVFSHNSKLLSLEIPKTVSSISIGFIQECEKMSSLSVESGNQTYSSPEGSNAIIRTANMELVAGCKNTIIPSGTKTIDAYAFQHCISLISIKIPESITTIGDFAFWGCNGLTELIIPASVTQIGNMAFYGCSALNSIIVDSENSVYDSRNNCNALIETSSNTLLLGCKNTIIPNGILNIGENAFRPCDGLTSIEIPASVISIGDNAFAYCYQLKRVISNIADPNTVVMGSTVFDRISGNAILKVPQGTKASYMAADGWKDAFSNIVEMGDQDPNTIDVAVAGTLSSLLVNPMEIEELTLTGDLNGTDLRLIREMAGNDYLGQPTNGVLKKLDISGANIVAGGEKYLDTDRVTSSTGTYTQNVGENSFHYATEDNVLGSSLFVGCDKLEEVILPNSITSIGNYVFWYCLNLQSLFIPEKVSSIGWQIVYGPNKISKFGVADGNETFSSPANSNVLMQGTKLIFGCSNSIIPTTTTIIGSNAFENCYPLGDVTIPEGVTTIEVGAFAWSGLTSIKMPSTLTTIGNDAFAGCNGLTSFTLPKSVVSYGDGPDGGLGALKDCQNLTSIKVEDGNPKYDSRNDCNAIIETATNTLVSGCQTTVIPNTVTTIGCQAFRGASLSDFVIPNWITRIGERAFNSSNITSVKIPSSVTSIGIYAFSWCNNLTTVTIENKVPLAIDENTFTNRANIDLIVPVGSVGIYKAVDYWKEFKSIKDTEGNTEPAATPISLTLNVETAGTLPTLISETDRYLTTELTLTGNLNGTDFRLIREMAGNDYLGQPTNGVLKKLDISGANIVDGGEKYLDADQVWSSHRSYTQWGGDYFHFNTQQNVLGNAIFAGCEKLIDIVLPKSITSIGDLAFWDCMNLESLVIPENVSSIGMDVFIECNKLSKVSVAEGNMTLSAPANCNVLMEGTTLKYAFANPVIPEGTTVIGPNAFRSYNGNADFVIPEGVVSIGNNAFAWSNIKSISLPSTLKRIDYWAFSLTQLESITIPASVEFIGERILNHCSNLTTITVAPDNPLFDSRDHCNAIIETATNTLIQGCKTTIIPESVTALGTTAFTECYNLTSITIPKSITKIGDYVFMFCADLKDVYSLIEEPFNVSASAFSEIGVNTGYTTTLHVPYGTKEAYLKADGWKEFKDYIVEVVMTDDVAYTLNEEEKTVTVEGSDQSTKEVEIQPVVEIEGEKYEVTAIGEGAFENNENLEKVSIPETIEFIGNNAFAGCTGLKEIRVLAEEPIKLGSAPAGTRGDDASSVFAGVDTETCTLYVPAGSKEKYEQADGWKEFKNIVEMGETTAITIGKSGKASYCGDKSLDFSFSEEIKAYIATGFDKDEGTIWLTRVKDVPAGVPVLIKGEAEKTYQVPITESQNSYYTNMFKGNISGSTVQINETDGDRVNYYLSGDGTFKSVKNYANIGNNKCYLQLPGTFKPAETGASQTVKVGSAGKASFAAPVDLDFTNVEGLKAFTATGYDKSSKTIWLTRVMKVQKGEGVLLKGDAKDYEIPSVAVQSSYMNMFVGNTSGDKIQVQSTSDDGSQTNFYLKGDGTFVSVNGYVNIGNNKSYLALPTSMVAAASTRGAEANYIMEEPEVIKLPISFRSIDNDGNGTTAIHETKQSLKEDGAYYTLQGQRVENPGKGLYIKNGKVVVIK